MQATGEDSVGHQQQQVQRGASSPSIQQTALRMPAFATARAAIDVSLSTSVSSDVSASASQQVQPEATAPQAQPEPATTHSHDAIEHSATAQAQALPQEAPAAQILSQLDTLKWDQVAAWAGDDSVQAAALVQTLGPSVAASVVSEPDRDHKLLHLEAQVARKKLVRKPNWLCTAAIGCLYCKYASKGIVRSLVADGSA